MKSIFAILSFLFVLPLFTAAYTGPCYNAADPDHNITNYCMCDGDGLCYSHGVNQTNACDPPGKQITCPESGIQRVYRPQPVRRNLN